MVEQMPDGWPAFVDAAKLKLLDECPDPGNAPHTVRLYALPAALGSHKLIIVHNASLSRDGSRRTYGITVNANVRSPSRQSLPPSASQQSNTLLLAGQRDVL